MGRRGCADAPLTTLRLHLGIDDAVVEDVRAVGATLSARVPELIEDFYEWLSRLPEFNRFFSSDAMLAHVKSQQASYWRDFLHAEVDDAYVERRRLVGQVHARIELGLLIYLHAMEFVSAWLRREVEADEQLRNARPLAAFSIRTLVQFDSSIVVETYAARTARMLEEQRERLKHVAGVMRAVTDGDLGQWIDVTGPEDLLGNSVTDMVRSLRNIAREMGMIARGDYSADIAPRSAKDELGVSLQAMTRALREAADRNEQLMWLARSQAELGQAMSGNPSLSELSQRALAHLCRAIGAHVGAKYVLEHGVLRLTGTYATAEGAGVPGHWKLGEGLVGQAALEKRRILVNEVPESSIRVRWGLGEALPKTLLVLPLLHDDTVRGVIELGSLGKFSELHLELLDRAASNVGLAITAAESRARIQQLLEESQAQGEELTAQQEELRQVNGTLEEQTRLLESQKDSLLATETVLRQKAVEVERTSRYKSEFLANMSHELRTPLNSTLLLARLLSENRDGNLTPDQVSHAQTISAAGNDLLELINDILDLAKIEAGKVDLDIEPVEIARLIDDLRRRFTPLIAEKKLTFHVTVDAGCPTTIETDHQRVQQVLTNLLSNAVKFTENGSIRLLVAPEEPGRIAFTVKDTGIGIPVEQHEVIFEAFRQADGTTNRKYGGTGLGLSISRELTSLLGGEIRLQSARGKGSAFSVLLSVHSVSTPKARTTPHHETTRRFSTPPMPLSAPLIEDDRDTIADSRRVVLVIEDDPAFAGILRNLAHETGFQCLVAGRAEDAFALAREHRPVAVVLDIGLPDESGLAVLEQFKRDPLSRHVPIHVVSAHDYQQIAREMGAVGYALKPVKHEELVAAFRLLEERLSRKVRSLLIVEDDAVQRDAVTRLLAADDVNLVGVSTADEALTELRRTTFDCVVLDLMLPEIDGFELLDRISEDQTCSFPPVIVYTARELTAREEQQLRRLSKSIIVKGARSPERLLEEVTLFLHQVESELPPEKQRMLRTARDRDAVFDGRRILLVEDDVRNVFALTSVLEPRGMKVVIARNGKEALARLHPDEEPVDLVLMDVMMPEMDGLEATLEIRKLDRGASLPVIALTAKAMPDDRQQCLAAGANDYVAKPIDIDKLLSLMRVWMPK